MCGHYLVEPTACTPASAWEKGQVENQVGSERLFTPRLRVTSYDELNAWLLDRCVVYAKANRHPEIRRPLRRLPSGHGARISPVAPTQTDSNQQLAMQPAPAGGRSQKTALECLQRRVAINGADQRAVAEPALLRSSLIPIRAKRRDQANAIRFAQLRVQRSRDRAKRRRINAVPGALELNAFETSGRFVHLEENHHRYAAETSPGEDDIGIAVAKVEGPGQCFCLLCKSAEQLA
jgi:hypothetical protein